jgi:hypothetical protein
VADFRNFPSRSTSPAAVAAAARPEQLPRWSSHLDLRPPRTRRKLPQRPDHAPHLQRSYSFDPHDRPEVDNQSLDRSIVRTITPSPFANYHPNSAGVLVNCS